MSYVIVIDKKVVETAANEVAARERAEQIRANISQHVVDDELVGALAQVGYGPAGEPDKMQYFEPPESLSLPPPPAAPDLDDLLADWVEYESDEPGKSLELRQEGAE
jgi:hypothetical protein